MTCFVDIGMVRIQDYLGRWPTLRGRRAASSLIVDAFSDNVLAGDHAVEVEVNADSGDIDGKFSVVVDGDEAAAIAVAEEMGRRLRERLPAATFEATIAVAANYAEAYVEIGRKRARGESIAMLPALPQVPVAKLCELCQQSPASRSVDLPGGDRGRPACVDCAQRVDHQASRQDRSRSAAAVLSAHLGVELPDDFNQLAALGGSGQNHVATVFADGNRFGAYFSALAKARVPGSDIAKFSSEVSVHARASLLVAARKIQGDAGECRTLVHLVGGDDVLVSVPAVCAWDFTSTYLVTFCELVEGSAEALGVPDLSAPSASAAIVFNHQSFPFARSAELADGVLRKAKAAFAGLHASIGWLDVTRRGASVDAGLSPWSLEQFDERAALLAAVSKVDRSQIGRVERIAVEAGEAMELQIADTLRRHGQTDLSDALAEFKLDVFLEAVDISMWWNEEVDHG